MMRLLFSALAVLAVSSAFSADSVSLRFDSINITSLAKIVLGDVLGVPSRAGRGQPRRQAIGVFGVGHGVQHAEQSDDQQTRSGYRTHRPAGRRGDSRRVGCRRGQRKKRGLFDFALGNVRYKSKKQSLLVLELTKI